MVPSGPRTIGIVPTSNTHRSTPRFTGTLIIVIFQRWKNALPTDVGLNLWIIRHTRDIFCVSSLLRCRCICPVSKWRLRVRLREPMSQPKLKPDTPPRYKQNVTATLTRSVIWVFIFYTTVHSGPSLNRSKRDLVERHGIKKLINREETTYLQNN